MGTNSGFRIDTDGTIIRNAGTPIIVKKKNTGWIVFLTILFLVASGAAYYFYNESMANEEYWRNRISNSEMELSESKEELESLREENQTLKRFALPIVVNNIQIGNVDYDGNVDTDFGNTIYDYRTMYLKPKISYYGVTNIGSTITLYSKFFKNGVLSTGTSSPNGYSTSFTLSVYKGSNVALGGGWGNKERGHWSAGQYRYELWYNGMCLKALDFTIY